MIAAVVDVFDRWWNEQGNQTNLTLIFLFTSTNAIPAPTTGPIGCNNDRQLEFFSQTGEDQRSRLQVRQGRGRMLSAGEFGTTTIGKGGDVVLSFSIS